MEPEWSHLQELVDRLIAAGNAVEAGGFRPTQGGFSCGLRDRLDAGIVAAAVAVDHRLTFDSEADELNCQHCWTTVYGGVAAARYQSDWRAAVLRQSLELRPSLFAFAGREAAMLALVTAHHERCLADPELNHPFSHTDGNPEHLPRLAAYWGEVLGGPPVYSESLSCQSDMLAMHAGNGDMSDLGRRFITCFMAAADDAGLPEEPEFRAALRAYMEWAVSNVLLYPSSDPPVPCGLAMPSWSWAGLVNRETG